VLKIGRLVPPDLQTESTESGLSEIAMQQKFSGATHGRALFRYDTINCKHSLRRTFRTNATASGTECVVLVSLLHCIRNDVAVSFSMPSSFILSGSGSTESGSQSFPEKLLHSIGFECGCG
jgi:hypothetical protein